MIILITGGAGFIGSHLVDKLIDKHELTVIDDLSTGKIEFIEGYLDKIQFIKSDIVDINSITIKKPDVIFHLAANADVRGGVYNTYIDIEKNIIATHELLEFMKYNCKQIVFTSSATIYGESGYKKVSENQCDFNPISMYGMSKLSAEKMIHVYHNNYGINATIFRLGNISGPRNTHGVIRDFVSFLHKSPKELKILGNGNQTKQYLDVDDCTNALINIGIHKYNGYRVYNLAHQENLKVSKLAEIVIDEMKLHSKCKYSGGDRAWIGDVPFTVLDIKKIFREHRWLPTISTEESIRRTVRYLIENKIYDNK